MKNNMNGADRILRIIVALAVGMLYFADIISGTTAILVSLIGLILLFTGMLGFCPLYRLFGFSTEKKEEIVSTANH